MTNSIADLASNRLKKLKVFIEHSKTHPVYMESSLHLEKSAIYKPLPIEVKAVSVNSANNNIFHKYNDAYFSTLKQELAEYMAVENIGYKNVFMALNLYSFYDYLTDLFLQKDQKVLVFTSDGFNFEQEVKYFNSGRVVVEYTKPLVEDFSDIYKEISQDDYKIVVICAQEFNEKDLKDFIDIFPENVVLVLRTNNPVAFNYINYANKTVLVVREFPPVMTIIEPPICFAISRREVIDLLNQLQLDNHIDTITIFNALYFTSLPNPIQYSSKIHIRASEGYNEILMNLTRENIELIKRKETDNNLYNISQVLRMPLDELKDFSSGNHFLGCVEDLKQSLINFINSEEGLNYYSQKTLLRNMIGNKISLINNKFHYNNILLGAGVSGLLETIANAFVNDGEGYKKLYKDRCLMFELSPDQYSRAIEKKDAIVEQISLNPDLSSDMDELINKAQSIKPKLILIDNPRIMIGTYFDGSQIQKLLTSVPETTLIVIDESQYSFAKFENEDFVSAIEYVKKYPNLIVLRSFSYLHAMAGMRLGYAVAQENLIDCMDSVRHPFDISPFSIHSGLKAIDGNEIFEKVTMKFVQEQKDFLYQYLNDMGLFYIKSATNSIVFSTHLSADELQERLLPYKIVLKPLLKNFVRISISEQKENLNFVQSLQLALQK